MDIDGIQLWHGDCLEKMKDIADGSVDCILTDLPYGTTRISWDWVIPFEPLWEAYKRIIKKNGAIVLTASQPFTTDVINSNREMFKYCWVWEKPIASGFLNAKHHPLKAYEDVVVFSEGTITNGSSRRMPYFPQMAPGKAYSIVDKGKAGDKGQAYVGVGVMKVGHIRGQEGRFPRSVIKIPNNSTNRIHPTQKPTALFEYLIRTYTNEGETVLDSCFGSGTTPVACLNTNRRCIAIEMDETYFNAGTERVNKRIAELKDTLFHEIP
jgi:site-specific DNA-methyltransferase (adenine-specific)